MQKIKCRKCGKILKDWNEMYEIKSRFSKKVLCYKCYKKWLSQDPREKIIEIIIIISILLMLTIMVLWK